MTEEGASNWLRNIRDLALIPVLHFVITHVDWQADIEVESQLFATLLGFTCLQLEDRAIGVVLVPNHHVGMTDLVESAITPLVHHVRYAGAIVCPRFGFASTLRHAMISAVSGPWGERKRKYFGVYFGRSQDNNCNMLLDNNIWAGVIQW